MNASVDFSVTHSYFNFHTVTPHAKKAFLFSIAFIVLGFLSGAFVILSYVTDIFVKTGSSLTPNNSSILISVTQIIANLCFLNIVERFNRRVMAIRH